MKERPILFNTEMVRAILDVRKTQTRRIIKPQPVSIGNGWFEWGKKYGVKSAPSGVTFHGQSAVVLDKYCPHGQPGDQLWVRETFCIVNEDEDDATHWIDYRATPKYEASHPAGWENEPDSPDALKWKPSIHMPRWASRIQLEIISVRVEQIQEISKKDVDAEGLVFESRPSRGLPNQVLYNGELYLSWHHAFAALWNKINGNGSWASNPWVWVVEFSRINDERRG